MVWPWQRVFHQGASRVANGGSVGVFKSLILSTYQQPLSCILRRNISRNKRSSPPTDQAASKDQVTQSSIQSRKKAILESKRYWGFPYRKYSFERKLEMWNALGPPPLSEYRLTFGKHKGKRLDEVPDSYLVKFLIPQHTGHQYLKGDCPIVCDAVEDFMKRHPDVKGQAGRGKTKPLKEGIMRQLPQKTAEKKLQPEVYAWQFAMPEKDDDRRAVEAWHDWVRTK